MLKTDTRYLLSKMQLLQHSYRRNFLCSETLLHFSSEKGFILCIHTDTNTLNRKQKHHFELHC